ncbi:TRAP transporter substrate-binding protein [Bacillus sp. FJAT-29814]|uniref:TRAP transporter substrate-binding protein n=1 Tax=Bacillus sp. FJAT-29814 TaxID=1729688 RepID=UPI0008295B2C|nr:TRAP transporter substrate-binding protein [Bacillus sp. FJAT-29814]
MKKKLSALLLFVLMISTVLAGCSGSGSEKADAGKKADAKGEAVVLKLGHIQSENDLWHKGALKFKEEVEKKSNGSIKIEVYPNSTLGGDRDMAEGLQVGTLDFALIAGVLGNFEPSIQLLELPYLFNSEEEYNKVIHGKVGKEISDRVLNAADIRILNFWDRGPRHVTSNKPINSLEDIKGLKIRIPEIKAMEVTWKAMGASPTTMAWNEVYTGLEQNVIEAQENPIPFIYGGRIQEVQKNLALTAHKYEYVTLSMSEMAWGKLSEDQQKVITEAAKVATDYENKLVKDETTKLLETMKSEGLKVTTPDTKEFATAAKKAHKEFAKTIDLDLYNQILDAIKK